MSAKEQTLRHIKFNSMSTRQAVKWFLLHERERHVDDILAIDRDLKKLKDVELPQDILNYQNKVYGNRRQRRQLARDLIKGKIKLERKVKIQNPLAKKEKAE